MAEKSPYERFGNKANTNWFDKNPQNRKWSWRKKKIENQIKEAVQEKWFDFDIWRFKQFLKKTMTLNKKDFKTLMNSEDTSFLLLNLLDWYVKNKSLKEKMVLLEIIFPELKNNEFDINLTFDKLKIELED